ncbi:oxygenase MpaB family protein [Archangium sp. Cb G35]|uniref:oxygenase MpaB family protein n=1 Tax=Archangium sp. Cb G35 TaxID=1920190 RepID=UPI00116146AA|nr:oxygenase MpaB family protein [Archangium sp. Cb G35]
MNSQGNPRRWPPPPEMEQDVSQDRERFRKCLDYMREHAAGETEGVYGPDSMTWMIYREPVILLGGLRAILLQIAHPAVASGVSQNSNFRNDLLGRARRTYTAMYQLKFGGLREATGAAKRIHSLHSRVYGSIADGAGPYRANDPSLLRWVHATLIDTAMLIFDTFVRPLSIDEKRRFYQETLRAAAYFGILPEQMPPTLEDFYAWYDGELAGEQLRVGDTALELSGLLFNSPFTRGQVDEVLTAGLMPERWREAYRLPWGSRRQLAWKLLKSSMRRGINLTPPELRSVTAWHQAQMRLALARGERPTLMSRALNTIDSFVDVPFSIRPVAPKAPADKD